MKRFISAFLSILLFVCIIGGSVAEASTVKRQAVETSTATDVSNGSLTFFGDVTCTVPSSFYSYTYQGKEYYLDTYSDIIMRVNKDTSITTYSLLLTAIQYKYDDYEYYEFTSDHGIKMILTMDDSSGGYTNTTYYFIANKKAVWFMFEYKTSYEESISTDIVDSIKIKKTAELPSQVTVKGLKYKIRDGYLGDDPVKYASFIGPVDKNIKKITIPTSIKVNGQKVEVWRIEKNACKGLKYLESVTIGKEVYWIEKNAFNGCKKLMNIIIKTKDLIAKNVGANAFKNIYKKVVIKCPKSVLSEYKTMLIKKGVPKTATFK